MTLVEHLAAAFSAQADPDRAAQMAAYMKTDMPFFGIGAPARDALLRDARKRFKRTDRAAILADVEALWAQPQREFKYAAIRWARQAKGIHPEALPLYRRLIIEGAWWDFVDEIASHLVGRLVRGWPEQIWPVMDALIDVDNLWIRRTAILCQLGSTAQTDTDRLFDYCRRRAHETDFFMRKAIGWALRNHGDVEPEPVVAFLRAERAHLSTLSFKEGSRKLAKRGYRID
jgi:3-methyladenine DNA glycosylase AlkD